jgi:hypothetical protein
MTTINQLTAVDSITAGDQFPVFSTNNGDARKAAASVLLAYIQENLEFPSATFTTQYAAPSATGFSVAITDGDDNIHLILTPSAGYAAGTITLPAASGAADGQEVLVNCTQSVATLTIAANGAIAVTGEPASLSANDFFRLKYDQPTQTWYRVG